MSKYEMQEKFVKHYLSDSNIIIPTTGDIARYTNSPVNYLTPNPVETKKFSIGIRDGGRLDYMYFFFSAEAKKELMELYENVRNGKIKIPRRAIPSEKYFREIWNRHNHVSNKMDTGFFYIISMIERGEDFIHQINGREVHFYYKAGFTQNPEERWDRCDKGYNFTSMHYKSILLLKADRGMEKSFKDEFGYSRVRSDDAYVEKSLTRKRVRYQGEYYRYTNRFWDWVASKKHLDITPEFRLLIKSNNMAFDRIDREVNSPKFVDMDKGGKHEVCLLR